MAKAKDPFKEIEDLITEANELKEQKRVTIPISPSLDFALGGGIQSGMLNVLTSKEKFGKTSTALHIASQCQRPEFGGEFCPEGRHVYFFDAEMRLKPRDLDGCSSLDQDRFHIIKSRVGEILTAEKILGHCEKTMHLRPGSVVIIDSFTFLITSNEYNSEITDHQMAEAARLLYKFCRRVAAVVVLHDIVFIGITHLQSNPGYGGAIREASGNAIKFAVENKLVGKQSKPWMDGDMEIGKEMEWAVFCSALNRPGTKISSYLRYNHGIDEQIELINLASELGLIQKGGAWFTFPNGEKIQGKDKASEFLRENPTIYNELNQQVRQLLYAS